MGLRFYNSKFYIDGECAINHNKNIMGIEKHTHDFVELVYIFKGKCVHTVDGREYPASHGDLLLINYGSEHSIKTETMLDYADILIKPEFVDESLAGSENAFSLLEINDFEGFAEIINKNNCFVHFSGNERERIELLIKWMHQENENWNPGGRLILKSAINMFLTLVFRKMAIGVRERFLLDEELLAYIRANCAENLSMTEIAEKCGYNPAYFSRLFKKYMGSTYTEHLMNCRIDMACRMLKGTDLSVNEIISECGFLDRTKFFKVFADKVGISPKKYREK